MSSKREPIDVSGRSGDVEGKVMPGDLSCEVFKRGDLAYVPGE